MKSLSACVNPFAAGNTPMCDWIFESVDNLTVHVASISSKSCSNSEADASELPQNLK